MSFKKTQTLGSRNQKSEGEERSRQEENACMEKQYKLRFTKRK